MSSIRQRSRSGDSSPVSASQRDIVASGNVAMAIVSSVVNAGGVLVRSSSDSSILLDTDKLKGRYDDLTLFILSLIHI